jgi:AcrR family transcriptional regulator
LARSSGGEGRPDLLDDEDLLAAPVQKRSREKRDRLKAAGLELFGEKGYEGTSIEEIARRARMAVGGFYQHFRSKRQLLLVLMDDLLERLSELNLQPQPSTDVRGRLRSFLSRAFSTDLKYLGAYRAWREAMASDAELARKQERIQAWTTGRVMTAFSMLQRFQGARRGVDVPGLARAMDSFFWNLLGQATGFTEAELNQWIDAATHLIYHALFTDA